MIHWDAPGPYVVAFSTRRGGVSTGAYESLNLGAQTGDETENVAENRRRACAAVDADAARLTLSRQVHGTSVLRADGSGGDREGDGLWTDDPHVPMLKLTADCLPIALARCNGRPALALLHAGRVGLLAGIAGVGVGALGGRVAAIVGPGIGPCCYEVGDDIRDAYRRRYGAVVTRGRNLDLWSVAERELRAAGAVAVERTDLCTACNPREFFSYRRDGAVTGRQGVIGYVA
jgi:YfiH family protein